VGRATTAVYWAFAIVLQALALLVMLVSLAGPQPFYRPTAKPVAAKSQIAAYTQALKNYKDDIGGYPTARQGLEALRTNPGVMGWRGPYVEKDIGPDPWRLPYVYRYRTEEIPEVSSLGLELHPGPPNQPSRRMLGILMLPIPAAVFFGYPFLPSLIRRFNTRFQRARL